MNTDIAIIGGGASGLSAALSAKMTNPSADVLVVEKLPRVGKKIIVSGNGKCNLSNMRISAENYHGGINAIEIISRMPDCKEFFTDTLGVLCVTGSEGRTGGIYPRSNSSTTVLNAFRLKMKELNVSELCDCEITEIKPLGDGFGLVHKEGAINCRKLIIAAGGYAAPSFGTDGSIMRLLKNMGYTTAKICPAVAPLRVNPDDIKGLKGIRTRCIVSALSNDKILRTEKGELQFNENNLSGICVFNLAYLFQKYENNLKLRLDIMPEVSDYELIKYLDHIRATMKKNSLEDFLTGAFIKNLAIYIMKKSVPYPLSSEISVLTNADLIKIIENIKSLEFKITGCSPWQNAQSTMGGISAHHVDRNLQSKIHRGLYFCGEILDVVGDCGGYNLQWAWSSGLLAGRKAAEDDKNK